MAKKKTAVAKAMIPVEKKKNLQMAIRHGKRENTAIAPTRRISTSL